MLKGRQWVATFLVLVIIGGLAYVGWTLLLPGILGRIPNQQSRMPNQMGNMNMNGSQGSNKNNGMQGMQMPQRPTQVKSAIALRNLEDLGAALTLINQAVDLITIDPYSRTTVPNPDLYRWMRRQPNPSSGINIFPNGNSSVNVYPKGPNVSGDQNTENLGGNNPNTNYVFDQNKLYQLHQKIYLLAQGVMTIQDLKSDLSYQASQLETSPPDYNTFVQRYNQAYQNKMKLDAASRIFQDAFGIINLNPYAPPEGYQFNIQNMDSLHAGIFKLSQGLTQLSRLESNFDMQMNDAAMQAQMLGNGPMNTNMGSPNQFNYKNLILMAAVGVMLILIIILIARLFSGSKRPESRE
jgi:hypothetical protein